MTKWVWPTGFNLLTCLPSTPLRISIIAPISNVTKVKEHMWNTSFIYNSLQTLRALTWPRFWIIGPMNVFAQSWLNHLHFVLKKIFILIIPMKMKEKDRKSIQIAVVNETDAISKEYSLKKSDFHIEIWYLFYSDWNVSANNAAVISGNILYIARYLTSSP